MFDRQFSQDLDNHIIGDLDNEEWSVTDYEWEREGWDAESVAQRDALDNAEYDQRQDV